MPSHSRHTGAGSAHGTPSSHQTSARFRRPWLIGALTLALLLAGPPALSYAAALKAPGAATWSARSVDWARDHGAAPLINSLENLYYTLHAPGNAVPTLGSLPAEAAPSVRSAGAYDLPLLPIPSSRKPLPHEGSWYPRGGNGRSQPAVYTTFFRPDLEHASVVVGAAWLRSDAVRAHLVAGTTQPVHDDTQPASVPRSDRPSLVATFNSGWRMRDIRGGFYLAGRTPVALVAGEATAAIDDSGRLSVGQWGRDISMNDHLVAARQNLALIVDDGHVAAGLDLNAHGQWGSPKNQYQYTGRSALGVDRRGNLLYVVGRDLNLVTLAHAMVDLGAVRGMELDIHNGMQTFSTWSVQPHHSPVATKLMPGLNPPADRYLTADQRDFFYLTAKR